MRAALVLGTDTLPEDLATELAMAGRPQTPPDTNAPQKNWQLWWDAATAATTRGHLNQLRRAINHISNTLHLRELRAGRRIRHRARRHHQTRFFFHSLRHKPGKGGGLRPDAFRAATRDNASRTPRPCRNQAERLEAADQAFAWMHDEQAEFRPPRHLTRATDAHPAPGPAPPRLL